MGGIEELPDDSGSCPVCGKVATTKCTACKQVSFSCVLFSVVLRSVSCVLCPVSCVMCPVSCVLRPFFWLNVYSNFPCRFTTATELARRKTGSCTSQLARPWLTGGRDRKDRQHRKERKERKEKKVQRKRQINRQRSRNCMTA